jgi:hypothetical protein
VFTYQKKINSKKRGAIILEEWEITFLFLAAIGCLPVDNHYNLTFYVDYSII